MKCNAALHFTIALLLLKTLMVDAQFLVAGKIRPGREVRNGLGNRVMKGAGPAIFTSQRTRLAVNWQQGAVSAAVALQDVRVWGADASTISLSDGQRLMVHEAWAAVNIWPAKDTAAKHTGINALQLKLGRQELSYDDVRLLGNLDWLQQARRHDMALLQFKHNGWRVELGNAFNQNSDAFGLAGTSYVPANVPATVKNSLGLLVATPAGIIPLAASLQSNSSKYGLPLMSNPPGTNGATQYYKSFTSLYVNKQWGRLELAALLFNDRFGKYKLDSVGSTTQGYVYGRRFVTAGANDDFDYSGNHNRYTYGGMLRYKLGKNTTRGLVQTQAAWYVQSGRNRDGGVLQGAFHTTISANYQQGKWSIMPGYDILSGNSATSLADEKFDPLYGTPHKHWGYMDYFYVGTGSPAGGLKNAYLKVKYAHTLWSLSVDIHHFQLHRPMYLSTGDKIGRRLGNEMDLIYQYALHKLLSIEAGYGLMIATPNMVLAKGISQHRQGAEAYRRLGHWAYLMVSFRPEFRPSTASCN